MNSLKTLDPSSLRNTVHPLGFSVRASQVHLLDRLPDLAGETSGCQKKGMNTERDFWVPLGVPQGFQEGSSFCLLVLADLWDLVLL